MYREKQREVADDLESFMHVINWIALSYHETNLTKSPERLQNFVRSMYLEHNIGQLHVGGTEKRDAILHGFPGFSLLKCPGLSHVISDWMSLCQEHYEAKEEEPKKLESHAESHSELHLVKQASFLPQAPFDQGEDSESDSEPENDSVPVYDLKPQRKNPCAVLSTHEEFYDVLKDAIENGLLGSDQWPHNDKLEDQFRDIFPMFSTGASKGRASTQSHREGTRSSGFNPAAGGSSNSRRVTRSQSKIPLFERAQFLIDVHSC